MVFSLHNKRHLHDSYNNYMLFIGKNPCLLNKTATVVYIFARKHADIKSDV